MKSDWVTDEEEKENQEDGSVEILQIVQSPKKSHRTLVAARARDSPRAGGDICT